MRPDWHDPDWWEFLAFVVIFGGGILWMVWWLVMMSGRVRW